TRGEELATDKFPELHESLSKLPDGTVLDGEAICFSDDKPLPFNVLQTRIGRKNLSKKILAESPMAFIAYDCLEFEGDDIRSMPLIHRRSVLEKLHEMSPHKGIFRLSPVVKYNSWQELYELRLQS